MKNKITRVIGTAKTKVRGAIMKAVTTPARKKFGAVKVNKARKELGY